jgi:GT2 family glycosyltransferase
MDITLVICTRDRARRLADALPHLARLRAEANCEIVFVNNGSSDTTREILAAFVESSGLDTRVVDEPRVGLSVARNTGWRHAAGEVIAFTDDDCYPRPDYVEQLRICFGEAELSYLGGRVLLFDHNDYPITIKVSEVREELPPRSFLPAGVVHGANLAMRREVLEIVGGFDERFGTGSSLESAEDIDLVARASAAGFRGAYDPRPVVFHHHRRSKGEDVRRLMAIYDIGRGAFYAKAVLDRRMRSSYFWPVLRRVGGNILRKEFSVMGREFYGAWKYISGSLS